MMHLVNAGSIATLGGLLTLFACREGSGVPPSGNSNAVVLWKIPSGLPRGITPHSPAANADRSMAYFATSDYRLKKIRGADGVVVWDVDIGPVRTTFPDWNVVLAGGVAVVPKVDVFAYDTATGAHRWTHVAPDFDETGYSSLTADASTVYTASRTARVYAIDARTGASRWIADLREGNPDVRALNAVYHENAVFVCTRLEQPGLQGTFWALNAATGGVLWKHRLQAQSPSMPRNCFGGAAIWGDLVIQPQADGRVFAFERASGTVRWIAPSIHDTTRSLGEQRFPAVAGNLLVVTSNDGPLQALDPATGKEIWRNSDIDAAPLGKPVSDEETVYVDWNHFFIAFDAQTGKVRWKNPASLFDEGTVFKGVPVIAADRIFVAGRDGSYALKK